MTSPIRPTKRLRACAGLSAFAALALLGCSSSNSMDWEQAYHALRTALDSDASAITLQQAAAVPYATMGVRIGGGPEQMVVLAGTEKNTLLWTSAARIALETRNGRIVSSSGFQYNLDTTTFRSDDRLPTITNTRLAVSTSRSVDFPDQNLYSVALDCDMSVMGEESISILGADIPAIRVEEHCHSSQLDWNFTNTFWLGRSSGFVWRSIQFIHPKLPAIDTEILRPSG